MPDLRNFGENQAKERLAALGIYSIYVDYQTRDRIPDIYDQFGPYVVLSTQPSALRMDPSRHTVVLGIRAPDPGPEPPPADAAHPPDAATGSAAAGSATDRLADARGHAGSAVWYVTR